MNVLKEKLSSEFEVWKKAVDDILNADDYEINFKIREGEKTVIRKLINFSRFEDFNPELAKALTDELRNHEKYHSPRLDALGTFRRICNQYYTKDKGAYDAFKKIFIEDSDGWFELNNGGGLFSGKLEFYFGDDSDENYDNESVDINWDGHDGHDDDLYNKPPEGYVQISEVRLTVNELLGIWIHFRDKVGLSGVNISFGKQVFQENSKFLSKIPTKEFKEFEDYNMFFMVTHTSWWGITTGFAILTSKSGVNFDWSDNLTNEELWESLAHYVLIMDNSKYQFVKLNIEPVSFNISGFWLKSVFLDPLQIVVTDGVNMGDDLQIKFKINEQLQPFLREILIRSDCFKFFNN